MTDCEKLSSGKAKATVAVGGWFIEENEIVFLDPNQEGLLCKTEKCRVENAVALAGETLTLTYTDEARMPIVKVLDSSASATVNGIYTSNGSYRAEGVITVRIVAQCDNGQFITQNFSHDFSVESAEEFLTEDMRVDVEGTVKSLDLTVTESDKRLIVCDAIVKVYGTALETREVEKTVDVYSVRNEVEKEESAKRVNTHFCLRMGREKVVETVKAGGGVSEVLGALTPCVTATARKGEDGLTVEGLLTTPVAYLDENGERKAIRAEIPFVSNLSGDYPCEATFMPEVETLSLSVRPRGGSDMEVSAELSITVRGAKEETLDVITGVTVGDEKPEEDVAISLYIAKDGESLWDVAKALNTDEKTLEELNKDVVLPLRGGEQILLYRGLE